LVCEKAIKAGTVVQVVDKPMAKSKWKANVDSLYLTNQLADVDKTWNFTTSED